MSTLHDLDNSEYLDKLRIPIDMVEVTRQATSRSWRLEFECHGKPFKWSGHASSEAQAEGQARMALTCANQDFHNGAARLVACVEGQS